MTARRTLIVAALGVWLMSAPAVAQTSCTGNETIEAVKLATKLAKCVKHLVKAGCDPTVCDGDAASGDPACASREATEAGKVAEAEAICAADLTALGCDPSVCVACLPDPEVCDEKDNDCDGSVDEDAVCGVECAHEPLIEGEALDPACDSTVQCTCDADPFCCGSSWDSLCVCKYSCTFDSGCGSALDCSLLCGF